MESGAPTYGQTPATRFAVVRILVGACAGSLLVFASYWTLRLGYADRLFHTGSGAAVARARQLAAGNAAYFAGDPSSMSALEESLRLNPRNSAGWIELGLRAESDGDFHKGERLLRQAARMDATYGPRWTLANFYFRRGDPENFWPWARAALEMAYSDQTPLFLLCWRVSQDPAVILARTIPNRPAALAQYLNFLVLQKRLDAAGPVGERLAAQIAPEALPLLLPYCDRLIETARMEAAVRLWNTLCARGLSACGPLQPEKGRSLTNGDFSSAPLSAGFDWKLWPIEGVTFARPGAGLRITFSGRQPENCRVLEQIVPLLPGRSYRLRYSYRSSGLAPGSGLRWQVSNLSGDQPWSGSSADLASEGWSAGELIFRTPPDASAGRITLRYDRALGTTRIEASLWLRQVSLE